MPAHYGVMLVPDTHKNALNVVLALVVDPPENAAQSENCSQPANATGGPDDDFTHWYGGRQYTAEQLAIYQDLANNVPAAEWPITGVSGIVTAEAAGLACAAAIMTVTTQDDFTTEQAQATLTAALTAQGLLRINWGD